MPNEEEKSVAESRNFHYNRSALTFYRNPDLSTTFGYKNLGRADNSSYASHDLPHDIRPAHTL